MTNKELITLIKLLKRHGCVEYRTPELTLVLDTKSQPRAYKSVTEASDKESVGNPQYNEEDTLFWSTPGIPDEKDT